LKYPNVGRVGQLNSSTSSVLLREYLAAVGQNHSLSQAI